MQNNTNKDQDMKSPTVADKRHGAGLDPTLEQGRPLDKKIEE